MLLPKYVGTDSRVGILLMFLFRCADQWPVLVCRTFARDNLAVFNSIIVAASAEDNQFATILFHSCRSHVILYRSTFS